MRRFFSILIFFLMIASSAWAERNEVSVGFEGGLMLPGMSPTSETTFTLATWTAGARGMYGVLDDLYLTASFSFTTFEGQADGYTYTANGLDYEGSLRTTTRMYHPQVGARYKLYSGHNLAPYFTASVGYLWSTFYDSRLLDNGYEIELDINDFSEGDLTVTVGVSLDYRVMNMLFVGTGFYFTHIFGSGILRNYFSVPVEVSYYW